MSTETNLETTGTSIPIACTLSSKAAAGQHLEWVDLQHRASSAIALDGGVRMTFPAAMFDDVEDLASRESSCCDFLRISTSLVEGVAVLEVLSDNPEAMPVISALSGIPLR